MQVEVNEKMGKITEQINEKCQNKLGKQVAQQDQAFVQCQQKEALKLDEESQVFNHRIFKAQEKAFLCFMRSLTLNQSNKECKEFFISEIQSGLGTFFDSVQKNFN